MLGSIAWRALMRRNVIYRRRNWIGSLLEIALPVFFVGILVLIKWAVENSGENTGTEVIPEFIPDGSRALTPLTFQDYVTAMQAKRVCQTSESFFPGSGDGLSITGMPAEGFNWQVPFVKCDVRFCDQDGQDASNFCEYAMVAVAGSSSTDQGGAARASAFAAWMYERYPALRTSMPFLFDFVQVFDSPEEMDTYVRDTRYGDSEFPKIGMGIVFEGNAADSYSYWLRQNSTNFNNPKEEARPAVRTTPATDQFLAKFAKEDDVCVPEDGSPEQGPFQDSCTGQYVYNGVLTMQRLVNDFILADSGAEAQGIFVAEAGVQYVQFPARSFETTGFFGDIAEVMPLMVILGFLYPVASMIGFICREKELRQKELMKMMSVTESDIGWSWFISFAVFHIVTATIVSAVSGAMFKNSTGFYLWIFWVLTLMSTVVFSMAVATLASKATRGILIGLLLFFIGVFFSISIDYQDASSGLLSLLSLHPAAAFGFGLQEIGNLEDRGVGAQSSSVGESDYPSGYTFNSAINSLIGDIILWGLLTFYLNRVIKPDYGQAQPWHFPCTALFKCCGFGQGDDKDDMDHARHAEVEDSVPNEPVGDALQRQSEGKNIEILGLRKDFGNKTAVDNFSLSMYSGQITALLGHNGAGKTTTIGMLTGALAPTAGSATVAGRDIRRDMTNIRKDIGICLQHDCLFPMLTVREHVQFFARLKGQYKIMSKEDAEAQIDQVIQDVALSEKRNTFSKNLSGGMKRKLSVAIAFCGGSSVVLLDEPTSGMDPFSRRFTWNVIRQYRQDRCIILTTHFMDEADILGDRIAIMSEGRLRCCGSSLFLKKTYGVGYQLVIEKLAAKAAIKNGDTGASASTMDALHGNDDRLKRIVTDNVHEASLLSNVGSEMSYQLPMGAASKFTPMFEGLDEEIDKGIISSYGVSITTLDEVFLLVARGESTEKAELASSRQIGSNGATPLAADADKSQRSRMDLENDRLFTTHVKALFRKRAANFRRDKKAWVCTTIVPCLFVLIGLIILTFAPVDRDLPPIELTLDDYNVDFTGMPRNPIVFNNPQSSFTCQPGSCAYSFPVSTIADTDETYFFCGYQARLEDETTNCSITESDQVTSTLNGINGASAEGIEASTVFEASLSLFNSSTVFPASQYGAIFYKHEVGSVTDSNIAYNESVFSQCVANTVNYTNVEDCGRFGGVGYIIQYNFTALHVSPLFQSLADQALAREALNSDTFTIQTKLAPLPITKLEGNFGKAEDAFSAWFLVVLSFPFISGAFATFVVSERESKAKHLQTVAGVEPSAYWISTFFWDVMNYQFPLWITVILFFAFGVDILTTTERGVVGGVIAILFLYGPASAGFTYCLSFAFSSPSLCNVFMIISGFLIGMGGPLTTFILTLLGNENPAEPKQNLIDAANIVIWVLRFIPAFNLGKGLFYAINIETLDFLENERVVAWSEPVLLIEVIFLALESVLYMLLAIQIDKWSSNPRAVSIWRKFVRFITFQCFCGPKSKDAMDITTAIPDDDDVLAEQERVLSGGANEDLIVISKLTKCYDNGKLAVNNMSLGIPPGQCFGLLGINGAGKTTTMQMLTAEFPPTTGDATLAGFSVANEPEKTRRRIGYCPQFDAHFDNMTGREHVELYAAIKGIPLEFVKEAAATKLTEVGLSDKDSDRLAAGYSGGMKRRLSLACAMIGQPQVVFLDECSTGVDPVARREIWQLISDMVTGANVAADEKTSVILTTHSMEECEALCPQIGIMANGRLRCLGSAQHLKNKFGQGFQVELKVKILHNEDIDYRKNLTKIAESKGAHIDEETGDVKDDVFFNVDECQKTLQLLTGDTYLSDMIGTHNPSGYLVYKSASSGLATLEEIAAFATNELRMRDLDAFIKEQYPHSVLRERQDSKARYEVPSQGIRISQIFSSIEENKEVLMLADYGVSQTSLEQVFNMHAAEAEKLKQGRDDS
jgi:ATP-binding cassette subfamily A (ABC1) protein 3